MKATRRNSRSGTSISSRSSSGIPEPHNDAWSSFRSLPGRVPARRGCVAVPVDENRVVVIGGLDSNRSSFSSVLLYNRKCDSYVCKLPAMNQARYGCGATVCKLFDESSGQATVLLFVFGGEDVRTNGLLRTAECLDLSPFLGSGTSPNQSVRVGCSPRTTAKAAAAGWKDLPPMRTKRKGLVAVSVSTSPDCCSIFVAGGNNGGGPLSSVEVLEVRCNNLRWKTGTDGSPPLQMKYKRAWFGATAVTKCTSGDGETVVVVAGGVGPGASDSAEMLSLHPLAWTELPSKLSTSRRGCSVVAMGKSQVAVIGGRNEKSMNDTETVEVLQVGVNDTSKNRRTRMLPSLKIPRSEFAAASLNITSPLSFSSQGAVLLVFGGFSATEGEALASTEFLYLTADDTKETEWQEKAEGSRLLQACADSDLHLVETHLSRRPDDIHFQDYDLRTPLHFAASAGHLELLKLLVERRARLESADRWGDTPRDVASRFHTQSAVYLQQAEDEVKEGNALMDACKRGYMGDVEDLIQETPSSVRFCDYDFRTPLHVASSEGHASIAGLLLENGANVTCRDRFGNTALDDARRDRLLAKNGMVTKYRDVVSLLEEAALTVEEGCKILAACQNGNSSLVEKHLQRRPSDVNFADYDHRRPLHLAACEGHLALVRVLVAKGARIDAEDRWKHTALDDASRLGHGAVADYLIRATIAVEEGQKLAEMAHQGSLIRVDFHLDNRPLDVNFALPDGRTALHLAAAEGHLEVVELLLERGADVNSVDRWCRTPVDCARSGGHGSLVAVMEEKRRSVLAKCRLFDACATGDVDLIRSHLESTPEDVNMCDHENRTPLHLASSNGHKGAVELLLLRGADMNNKDRWGCTAMDDAIRHKFPDVVTMFVNAEWALRLSGKRTMSHPPRMIGM